MTQPMSLPGRPQTPAPGAPTPEMRVAQFRTHARRLGWSVLILIGTAGAVGYFYGNLPAPFEDWMLLTAAGALVLLLVVLPYAVWLGHTFTITTRRVIERHGVLSVRRSELSHSRGYSIRQRSGPLQWMWGVGTLTLSNGVDAPMQLRNIPSVSLVHEVLADQVEVSQILAHRDSHAIPTVEGHGPPPPLPH